MTQPVSVSQPFLLTVTHHPASMHLRVPMRPAHPFSISGPGNLLCHLSIVRNPFFKNPRCLLPSPVTDSPVTCALCPPAPVHAHFRISHSRRMALPLLSCKMNFAGHPVCCPYVVPEGKWVSQQAHTRVPCPSCAALSLREPAP